MPSARLAAAAGVCALLALAAGCGSFHIPTPWNHTEVTESPPPGNAPPSDNTSTDPTLNQRVQAELAAARLQAQLNDQTPAAPLGRPAAALVSLDGEAESAAPHVREAPKADPDEPRAPQTEEQVRSAVDRRFQAALVGRDIFERRWAFQFAAAQQREEAVPVLVREIQDDAPNAALAATVLGVLGRGRPECVAALTSGLGAKDGNLRYASVCALGRLRAAEAVKPLLKVLDAERNYRVRVAVCEALGLLGDSAAVPRLKAVMAAEDEVELTRHAAAFALARLGDRSGRDFLFTALGHSSPSIQIMGLRGLVALNDPDGAAYVSRALESRHEEVWLAALNCFPDLGLGRALPVLRGQLRSALPDVRRRASLALGALGSAEGVAGISAALREGSLLERQIAAELLGRLGRKEQAPLLIEKLRDPARSVREASAMALVRLKAQNAVPALIAAAQEVRNPVTSLAQARDEPGSVQEQLVLLTCIRVLKGEKEGLELKTMPAEHSTRWPEYDRELFLKQIELVKSYELVAVLSAEGRPTAAILRDPAGKETLVKAGEQVAGGFRVRDLAAAESDGGKVTRPGSATLARSDTRITLITGRPPEVEIGRQDKKDMGIK